MLSDFNITKDTIDRYPPCLDDETAITTLRNKRHRWDLQDAWRHDHPNHQAFTYRATANGHLIKSHLDRIYATPGAMQCSFNWQHDATLVPTDHWIVSVKYAPLDAPYIGKGRWTWNSASLQRTDLTDKIIGRGIKLQADLEHMTREQYDRETTNPQLLWNQFKTDIKWLAK